MDKWTEQAARLLPCQYPSCNGERYPDCTRLIDCAAHYRPAVAAALAKAAAQGAEQFVIECDGKCAQLRAEVARLTAKTHELILAKDSYRREAERLTTERDDLKRCVERWENDAESRVDEVIKAHAERDAAVVQGLEIALQIVQDYAWLDDGKVIRSNLAAEIAKRKAAPEGK